MVPKNRLQGLTTGVIAAFLFAAVMVPPAFAAGEDSDVGDGSVPFIIMGVVLFFCVAYYAIWRSQQARHR